jgi:hypothetical protein
MGMFDIKPPEFEGVKTYEELIEIYYSEFNCYQKYTSYHELKSGKTVRQHKFDMLFRFMIDDFKDINIDIKLKRMKESFVDRFKKENPRWANENFDEGYGYVEGKVELPYLETCDFREHVLVDGYVTREGVFYACEFERHVSLCDDLKKHGLIDSGYDEYDDTYKIADELGWIKLSNYRIYFRGRIIEMMSKEQKNFLTDFCVHYNLDKVEFNGTKNTLLSEILEQY